MGYFLIEMLEYYIIAIFRDDGNSNDSVSILAVIGTFIYTF